MKHPHTTPIHPAPVACVHWRKHVLEQLRHGTPRCLADKWQLSANYWLALQNANSYGETNQQRVQP